MQIKEVIHSCLGCKTDNKLRVTLDQRTIDDKETVKEINTAYYCISCNEFNSFYLSEIGIDYQWKA